MLTRPGLSFNTTNRPNIDITNHGIVNSTGSLIVAQNFSPFSCSLSD